MPRTKVYPPSWCYPSSFEFECEACGALPGEECDPAPLYGRVVKVTGGQHVHFVRFEARKAEVFNRVAVWREHHAFHERGDLPMGSPLCTTCHPEPA